MRHKSRLASIAIYVGFIILTLLVEVAAGVATQAGVGAWYAGLKKPFFTPPPYVFGPVWTLLYLMLGLAGGMIATTKHPLKFKALLAFFLQLFMNGLWSFWFFSWHQITYALLDLLCTWILTALTLYLFAKIKLKAAWLLLPYQLWLSFALILNASILYLN